MLTRRDLDLRFGVTHLTPENQKRAERLRLAARGFAEQIDAVGAEMELIAVSREFAVALTKLQEASMWAVRGVCSAQENAR